MTIKISTPKNASAIILLDHESKRVLWARRNPKLKFLGGFHGFPGGKVDENDSLVEVRNADEENARLIACAVRELFEEVGVLLVRNGERLTSGQTASLHDDLISGRSNFAEILSLWGLWIEARDFRNTGFWTTPEFSRIRFKTHFFIASCPEKQIPYQAITELQEIEFIDAEIALDLWSTSKVLIAPPVLIALRELESKKEFKGEEIQIDEASHHLQAQSVKASGNIGFIELNSRLICLPLKTNTLPPATHTNCFIVGKEEFIVIDAATPFEDEQRKLLNLIDGFIEKGYVCREIIVSHLHKDHYGGESVLKRHLKDQFDVDIPISAHEITIESLKGEVEFDKTIKNNKSYNLKDKDGSGFDLAVLHTPGHAKGHLCFYDEEFGFLLSSDNVVGQGTVLIALPEGNMIDYLDSLRQMKSLPGLKFLCGSHGAATYNAREKIESYIEHRLKREETILQTVREIGENPADITERVYSGLDPGLFPLAEKSVEAHLEKLKTEKRI